mmetsp:Transcript_4407/g.10462  ORF Transcript_4407/g.10462 Transcript_4407/m.10462 type:complete len:214 (+) Transcript_4407:61-702(+)
MLGGELSSGVSITSPWSSSSLRCNDEISRFELNGLSKVGDSGATAFAGTAMFLIVSLAAALVLLLLRIAAALLTVKFTRSVGRESTARVEELPGSMTGGGEATPTSPAIGFIVGVFSATEAVTEAVAEVATEVAPPELVSPSPAVCTATTNASPSPSSRPKVAKKDGDRAGDRVWEGVGVAEGVGEAEGEADCCEKQGDGGDEGSKPKPRPRI